MDTMKLSRPGPENEMAQDNTPQRIEDDAPGATRVPAAHPWVRRPSDRALTFRSVWTASAGIAQRWRTWNRPTDEGEGRADRARLAGRYRRSALSRVPAVGVPDRLGHTIQHERQRRDFHHAILRTGGVHRAVTPVHRNDDVSHGPESNDTFQTAIHIAAVEEISQRLLPSVRRLRSTLDVKARAYQKIFMVGRTHLRKQRP
jgi:hypothetical protein